MHGGALAKFFYKFIFLKTVCNSNTIPTDLSSDYRGNLAVQYIKIGTYSFRDPVGWN